MRKKRNLFIFMLAIITVLASCQRDIPEYHETQYLFGTLVEFTIRDMEPDLARKAVAMVTQEFQHMHRDWHAWKPGELSQLNQQLADGKFHRVSPFLLPLIRQAKQLSEQSDDLFNPAIGKVIALWGFHSDELPTGPPPSSTAIQELVKQHPRMENVIIEDNQIRSNNPLVSFDFGGFAKGAAIDIAMQRLQTMGVKNAVINAGGDLNVIGNHGERSWRVGIRHPQGQGVIATVELKSGEVIYTSGNYERYREHEGRHFAHIIDPRTGLPVEHIASATVIDTVGAKADAAATALTVAGPDAWYQIAQRMQLKYVMLVSEAGRVYMNPAMAKRLEFETPVPESPMLSAPL